MPRVSPARQTPVSPTPVSVDHEQLAIDDSTAVRSVRDTHEQALSPVSRAIERARASVHDLVSSPLKPLAPPPELDDRLSVPVQRPRRASLLPDAALSSVATSAAVVSATDHDRTAVSTPTTAVLAPAGGDNHHPRDSAGGANGSPLPSAPDDRPDLAESPSSPLSRNAGRHRRRSAPDRCSRVHCGRVLSHHSLLLPVTRSDTATQAAVTAGAMGDHRSPVATQARTGARSQFRHTLELCDASSRRFCWWAVPAHPFRPPPQESTARRCRHGRR